MTAELSATTLLKRAPNVTLEIDSSGDVWARMAGNRTPCGQCGLAVLHAFAHPTTFAAALQPFKANGLQHWVDVTSTVVELYRAGVLRDSTAAESPIVADVGGFGSVPVHIAMLNDTARTSSFIAAVGEVVRHGDIVVDIGTGTGVLAVAAARAGAAHVYAIEASGIGAVAQSIFQAAGLEDRITLIPGWSTEVKLPEPADVMVSETVGNDPWAERILEVAQDAQRRLLKPTGTMVPYRITLFGLPVNVPCAERSRRIVTPDALGKWRLLYDVDFSPLAQYGSRAHHSSFSVLPQLARDWCAMSEPVPLADMDLTSPNMAGIESTTEVTATSAGEMNGLLLYFDIFLSSTVHISTHPVYAHATNHWRSPVFLFGTPLEVRPGDRFGIHYSAGIHSNESEVRLIPR